MCEYLDAVSEAAASHRPSLEPLAAAGMWTHFALLLSFRSDAAEPFLSLSPLFFFPSMFFDPHPFFIPQFFPSSFFFGCVAAPLPHVFCIDLVAL